MKRLLILLLSASIALGAEIRPISTSGGAGVTDGDKGDITVSASGATWNVNAGSISLGQMADMATSSFLGRVTGGTGAPEVLNQASARLVLGATTVGGNILSVANPGAVTYLRINADNTVTARTAAELRTDLDLPALSGNNVWTGSNDFSASALTLGGNAIVFEGATADAFETTVGVTDPTADRAIVYPDAGGEVVLTPLREGGDIRLDSVLSADGAVTGITMPGVAGTALAFGDLVYLDPTDSRWELVDANAASAADGDARGIIGLCIFAAAADADLTVILLQGTIRADAAFPAFTVNAPIYASETAGDVTNTSPTSEDNVVRVLGFGLDGNSMYFAPSATWITYDAP